MEEAFALGTVLLLAGVHLFSGHLHVRHMPRSRWLSAGGGVSVAYVFVHILPNLGEHQEAVEQGVRGWGMLEHHVYLVAMAGLLLFYGLERHVMRSRQARMEKGMPDHSDVGAFWVSMVSYGTYNAIIGYLAMDRTEESLAAGTAFAVAMALHFVVNDHGLRHHHRDRYHFPGRWVLAGAIVGGYVLALGVTVPRAALAVPVALLAGGVIMNVLKEELPQERDSHLGSFVLGAVGYAAVLLVA